MKTNKNGRKLIFTIFTLTFSFFVAGAQTTYVFFGSFNRDKSSEGIIVYKLDMKSGVLTKVSGLTGYSNPSYLTLSENGNYIFFCTESKTPNAGSVTSFRFDSEKGLLSYINSQKSGGENPVYLSLHKSGKWLINGNYTQSSISVYPVNNDGFILPPEQILTYSEGSVNSERQDRSHIHSCVFSPECNFVFAPDLGSDKIRQYKFESSELSPLKEVDSSFVKTVSGAGPRHFTFHPNGNFAYCIEELSGTVQAYAYRNGKLDSIQRISAHSINNTSSSFESSDIHLSPDGRHLYVSNRGRENNIAVFSVQESGKLKIRGYQSTFGEHPRIFAIDETGQFLIVTHVISGNVFVFKRNLKTGLLNKVGGEIKIENVSCVKIKTY